MLNPKQYREPPIAGDLKALGANLRTDNETLLHTSASE